MKKLNIQKLYCLISIIFLLSCCIIYGTRFIRLYLNNKADKEVEENSLAKVIRDNNYENELFKEISNKQYFINNSDNNYLEYSNLIWRIIKINQDNSITAISEYPLTSLAFGENMEYLNSYIFKWLNNNNEDYSGILENHLNNPDKYLEKTLTCLDKIENIDNSECQNINNDYYLSLLSSEDFTNIGNKQSYVLNNTYFYLNNTNNSNHVWYITSDGKLMTSKGTDIIGVKPVITIKSNIDYLSGDGSINNPYKIEEENGLFGSYVKLDNDIWRIYQVNDNNNVRLILNDYLKEKNTKLTHSYSNNTSYHNDTIYGSIAYYLNHDYLNSLSYKNILKETKWANGFYDKTYNYINSLKTTIDTTIALPSIGDIKVNNLTNYFTMTGTQSRSSTIYIINDDGKIKSQSVTTKANIIPTISLDKSLFIKGNGTIESPYEME